MMSGPGGYLCPCPVSVSAGAMAMIRRLWLNHRKPFEVAAVLTTCAHCDKVLIGVDYGVSE